MGLFRNNGICTGLQKCIRNYNQLLYVLNSCSCDNCASINVNDQAKLRLSCLTTCPHVVWYIEDLKPLTVSLKQQQEMWLNRPV